jgi:SnoaL-like domain
MSFQASAERFMSLMESGDLSGIDDLLARDVTFHSPVLYRPFEGREIVCAALPILRGFFSDASYPDVFHGPDKSALMFEATIAGRDAEGLQLLTFDHEGKIAALKVLLRPLTAAIALSESMAPHLEKTERGYAVKK